MNQSKKHGHANVFRCERHDSRKNELQSKFRKEKKKLEDLVAAHFASGTPNLGSDVNILNQSVVIDRLIVDKMKLEELCARYKAR